MRLTLVGMLGLLASCTVTPPDPDLRELSKADGNGVLVHGLYEQSHEALAVLAVANELSEVELDTTAGLDADAARSIVAERPFETLSSLAAADQVGPATIRRLFRFADLSGYLPYGAPVVVTGRVVAIGDLHGDYERTREALELAGAIDERNRWIGADLVVVQVGDQLDRGDGEERILALLESLAGAAALEGGAVVALNGNHEVLNVQGDLRYVTDPGLEQFGDGSEEPRAGLLPGGSVARVLARHDVIAQVGGTLFAHAGVLPAHVDYGLSLINHEARAWMIFEGLDIPAILDSEDGPVWYRGYGTPDDTDCALVEDVLARTGAQRMVIAHTVQDTITSDCDETLYRVDVGLSAYYDGPVEALEIDGETVSVLYWE